MNFGQSLGAVQQNKQEAFRRALQKAYIRNGSVTYTLKNNDRMASVSTGFFQGQAIAPQSAASVTWQKGRPGDFKSIDQGSFAFWQIDNTHLGDAYGLPRRLQKTYNADGSPGDHEVYVPASIYKVDETRTENYRLSTSKDESHSGIDYRKNAVQNDSASGTLYLHYNDNVDTDPGDDDTPAPDWTGAFQKPYTTSESYTYDKGWYTPHDVKAPSGEYSVR
jgi:hypothetical protein